MLLSPTTRRGRARISQGKGVYRAPPERRRGAHLPFKAVEPVGGWTTESVTHGQCDARPTATFPVAERRRPLAGTKLYCLVTRSQGRVSNPSERGTGGRAPKAPMHGVGSGPWRGGCAHFPEIFFISYIKMVSFYAFPAIFIDTVLFKKGTLIKGEGCPDTLDTPWIRP